MKPSEKSLLKIMRALTSSQQETLLTFAEFLASRKDKTNTSASVECQPPVGIPRPESESVIAAMKRLSATYPMLEKSQLLNQTSPLMAQHIMQGREAKDVIDELETVFQRQYAAYTQTTVEQK